MDALQKGRRYRSYTSELYRKGMRKNRLHAEKAYVLLFCRPCKSRNRYGGLRLSDSERRHRLGSRYDMFNEGVSFMTKVALVVPRGSKYGEINI